MKGREGRRKFLAMLNEKKVVTEVGPGLTRKLRIGG